MKSLLVEVFQGQLRAGQHLVARELAARFGVSPTPIREALIALEGIGIVDLLPNRGAVIRRITATEVSEICQVRSLLECEATRRASGWIAPAKLRSLSSELQGLLSKVSSPTPDFPEAARAVDDRLHDLIAASCRNSFLAKELGRLKILFRAFRDVTYTRGEARFGSGRYAAEAREHLAIVESLQAEDSEAAARSMADHIKTSVEIWSRSLPVAPEGGPRGSTEGSGEDKRVGHEVSLLDPRPEPA